MNNRKRWHFPGALALLVLAVLACSKAAPEDIRHYTRTPTSSPTPSENATARPSETANTPESEAESPIPTATPILAEITALQAVNIRAEAGESSAPLGVLYKGAQIQLTGACDSEWAEIRFGAGRAWIRSRYISGDPCKEEE